MNIFGVLPPARPKVAYAGKEKLSLDWSGGKQARTADERDGIIVALWALHLGTLDIARKMGLRESLVANRLAAMRDGAPL